MANEQLELKHIALGIDDADIFFVYAKNFFQGHGLVYNIGGERVEGFTSLLWVLIASVAFSFSNAPQSLLLIFNIMLLSLVLTGLTFFIDNPSGNKQVEQRAPHTISFGSLLFLSIVCSSPRYIAWTTFTLMDVGIWSTVLVALTLVILRLNSPDLSIPMNILIVLLLIARPEGILWGVIFIVLAWIKLSILHDNQIAVKFIRIPLIIYCVTFAGLTLFRLFYFGFPLPNTYYAKVSPSIIYNIAEGIKYLFDYILFSDGWASLSIFCAVAHGGFLALDSCKLFKSNTTKYTGDRIQLNDWCIIVLTWAGLLIPVINGGDHFGSHRFYQAVYPLLILNLVVFGKYLTNTLISLHFRPSPHRFLKVCTLYGLILLFPLMSQNVLWKYFDSVSMIRTEFTIAENGRNLGTFMTEFFTELNQYPTIGVVTAGGVKLMYEGPIFDLMGLNNIVMGHSKGERKGLKNHAAFEKDVFFTFLPDIVTPSLESAADKQLSKFDFSYHLCNKYLKGLCDDSKFRQLYTYIWIHKKILTSLLISEVFFIKNFCQSL